MSTARCGVRAGSLSVVDEVTRGEFDLLRQMVGNLDSRVTTIDDHGTRGVGAIQIQLSEVIKDLADMKAEFKAELRARLSARRWAIGIMVGSAGAFGGLLTAVVTLAMH